MKMNKGVVTLLVVALLGLVTYFTISGSYNGMVEKREGVRTQWAQVENVYQRRADLIPNLVNTVKGVSGFEERTLTELTEARSRVGSVQMTADDLGNEDKLRAFEAAQARLNTSLGRLIAVTENYPQLQATQAYRDLMTQLEGSENRIAVERRRFNEAAQGYNTYIATFPRVIFSGMLGFSRIAYFQADAGADKVPEVKF